MNNKKWDAVIVGGGHNGLVTACYLARTGLKVLVLERRHVLGGACVTEEVWPGYRVSTLSYLCSLLQPQIINDLELKRFGYHIYPKDPSFFTAFPDGRHLFFWQDEKKTHSELSKFSRRDADHFARYEEELSQLADWVEQLLMESPPNIVRRRMSDLAKMGSLAWRTLKLGDAGIARLVKIMTQSVRDFLDERFESPEIKTTLATDGVIGTNGGPSTPGTAYILLHHVMGGAAGPRGLWGFIRGGMGAISTALARAAEAHGVTIRANAGVKQILVANGRATGVVLDDGEEINAEAVISNADPKRTFLKLIDRKELDDTFRSEIEGFRIEGSSIKINLALDGLPQFTAYPELGPGGGPGLPHLTTMHVCPSMEYIDRAWEDARQGRPSADPMLECTIPTAYDDSIAPQGKHIMCIFAQYAPYKLAEGEWSTGLKDQFADRCINALADYAPNIKDLILHRQVISPFDLEQEYGMTGGNIFHGDMSLDQLFFMRPVAGWARYQTPIHGLYLCGSGTHPGGGVMGAPGYNAAREILRNLRRH
jgi:phytoene dehydrogenase-like protein